ncbi:uncharacterized protein LOC132155168 isoform X2 [Carassius carassius]|uniref:uncharacterized protein LOC132155168 isoform X2 n=1 Tax=Carassius carassius TaxID=217509 RepID=UPI00286886C3|nr:uncharacterized protein LOC132155168 isoform X2 [Carassius carassius]
MAYGKIRERLFLILSSFACITLVQCGRAVQLSKNEDTNDGGKIISEQSLFDHDGYEALPDFEYLGGDAIVSGQVSSSEAAWYAMSPKLRCGDDFMKLQLSGPEVAQIELCQGNGAAVPLNDLPPHCGSTIPTYGGVTYATPYDGCGVAQQGGSYVMQMQWQGNRAVISCPMTSTTANETFLGPHSASYPQLLLPLYPDKLTPQISTMPEPSAAHKPPPYGYPEVFPQAGKPPSDAQVPTQKPQFPKDPHMMWPYPYSQSQYPGKGYPTAEPAGESSTDDQAPDQKPQFPKDHHMWPYPYSQSQYPGKGYPTAEPAGESSTDDQAPDQKPQFPKDPHMMWPYPYSQSQYPGKGYPTAEPAGESSTDDQAPDQKPQFPKDPYMMWPYPIAKPGGKLPSDAQVPTQKPPFPKDPHMMWPYPIAKPGGKLPSDAQVPTQKPQFPKDPHMMWPYPIAKPGGKLPSDAQVPTQKPPFPKDPHMMWPYPYSQSQYPGKGYPTAGPAGESSTDDQKPQFPKDPYMMWPYPIAKPGGKLPSDAQMPTQKPPFPKDPHMMWPYPYSQSQYPGKGYPTAEPAGESSTDDQKPQFPKDPYMMWPYPIAKPGGKLPSDAQVPTQKPPFPKDPHMMWPYPYSQSQYPGKGYPTAEPAGESSTDDQAPDQKPPFPKDPHMWQKPQPPIYPGSPFPQYSHFPDYLQQFYSQYPMQPLKTPTASPITTTPQPCTTTAAAECVPSANQPLKEPPQYYKPPSYMRYEKDPFALKFVDFSEIDRKSFPRT